MKIELLNVHIEIQKNTVITDRIGNHTNGWVPYYCCHSTVSAESPKESTDTGVVMDESKVDFTVRWCRKTAAVTSTGYRILFNGEPYNILGIDHLNYKRRAIKYLCQKVSRT